MFGGNKQVAQVLDNGLHLRVQSVFPTIQGEGPFVGYPCLFIRLNGCNLRCTFCDTDFESRKEILSIDSLVQIAVDTTKAYRFPLVVLTGGEPLLQNVIPLIQALESKAIEVQIETAGTVWIDGLERTRAMLVCSPKTPNVHQKILANCDHWKYIVRAGKGDSLTFVSERDGLPTLATQAGHEGKDSILARPPVCREVSVYLQPCEEYTEHMVFQPDVRIEVPPLVRVSDTKATARNTALAADLCLRHGYRLSVQVHKIIGLP